MKSVRNQELEDHVKAVESDLKISLIVPSKLKNTHPIINSLHLKSFTSWGNEQNQKLFPEKKSFDVIVGKSNLNRAKLILDTFFKAIEGRGHSIAIDEENSYLEAFGEKLRIRFWEKSKYIGNQNENSYRDMELSGILSIQYFRIRNYVEREWADTPYAKLEEKLGRVIGSLEFYAKKEKAERLEQEERWRVQKVKEELIKERNARKEKEFKNFKTLLDQSQRWEKAQSLRSFINHIQNNPSEWRETENLSDWISWAKDKADWLDPTFKKKDPFLNPFGDFHDSLLDLSIKLDRYNIDKL